MKALLSVLFLGLLAATTPATAGGPPVNDTCPVCGKAGRLIFRTFSDKGTVIFATAECKDSYQKEPARYPVKPKAKP